MRTTHRLDVRKKGKGGTKDPLIDCLTKANAAIQIFEALGCPYLARVLRDVSIEANAIGRTKEWPDHD